LGVRRVRVYQVVLGTRGQPLCNRCLAFGSHSQGKRRAAHGVGRLVLQGHGVGSLTLHGRGVGRLSHGDGRLDLHACYRGVGIVVGRNVAVSGGGDMNRRRAKASLLR
jgi:hypothetical protein